MAKIAINGFGRIGRLFFRQAFDVSGLEIVAINDLGDVNNLAYLLKYDTTYGRYDKAVEVSGTDLVVNGKTIKVVQVKDPTMLPWKDLQVDLVVESTGLFESFEKSKAHLDAGAKRVVITAPAKDEEGTAGGKTILMGINDGELATTMLSSNGSCTTNATSPVMQILSQTIGILKAHLNTVHGYTATQNLQDGPAKGEDHRRGRAAAENIVPSTTGAAISVVRAIPALKGKFDGMAMRVPVRTGSISEIVFLAKRPTTAVEINDILRKAAIDPRWQGIFAVTEDQIVSSDVIGQPYGAIADLNFTTVVDGDLVRVLSWYDNEAGYVSTLVRHVLVATAKL
jgi:glyceraldehyde 3-phosphate dehydrogenase